MSTKEVVKQVVRIDISMDSFYACYKIKKQDNSIIIKGSKSFKNTVTGMKDFALLCKKRDRSPDNPAIYVMEATGVYYEELAYYLYGNQEKVSVQLAQKLKYFAKSYNLKTKTDKVDAKMIAAFGMEKNLTDLSLWTPPSKEFKIIRDLSREHSRLVKDSTAAKSQLHALEHAHGIYEKVIEMKENMIAFYTEQIKAIEDEIKRLIKADEKLLLKVKNIETVKGLGFMTIVKVLSEVNGFLLFKNIGQLISYAGLDVI